MPAILRVLRNFDNTHEPREGTSVSLGDVTAIGRRLESSICLPPRTVSRNHARIQFRDGAYHLEDLGSRNHTHLNGRQLDPSVPVRITHRDQIRVCGFEAIFLDVGLDGKVEHPGDLSS